MPNTKSAAPLECERCGGEGHVATIDGLDEGYEECGCLDGRARCWFCNDIPATTHASHMGEPAAPSCGPCAESCETEGEAA